MDLAFFPLTLDAVDQAAAESLCLFIGADERPLTGLAGLADWRLSGKLSRLLRSGLLTGQAGESVLTPPGARLAFRKLFLFGLGPRSQGDAEIEERVGQALRKVAEAGVQEAALQLPERLSADAGIRTLLDELQGPARAVVFASDPQRLVAALSQAARGAQGQVERRVVKVQTAPLPAVPPRAPSPLVRTRLGPPAAQPIAPPQLPKASPLPFAPERDAPAAQVTAPPAPELPRASPLPFAPVAQPLPDAPTPQPPIAPAVASEPPAAEEKAPRRPAPPPAEAAPRTPPPKTPPPDEEKRPAPPSPQRYVPPVPKQNVFDSKKRKK